MNDEINFLKEHLYDIYMYKKSQKDVTYDMDLELLLRISKLLNTLQSNWNSLRKIIKDLGIDYLLDKMNELEGVYNE